MQETKNTVHLNISVVITMIGVQSVLKKNTNKGKKYARNTSQHFSCHHVRCSQYSEVSHHLAKPPYKIYLSKQVATVMFAKHFKNYKQMTNVLFTTKNTNESPFGKTTLQNIFIEFCLQETSKSTNKSPLYGVKDYNAQ